MSVPDPAVTDWVPIGGVGAPNELAYAQITADAALGTGQTVIVTAPAFTADAQPILVEFSASAVVTAGSANVNLELWQDGVSIGVIATFINPAAGLYVASVHASRRLTPAAGSRTYSIRGAGAAGAAIWAGAGGAGARLPAFIRITRA